MIRIGINADGGDTEGPVNEHAVCGAVMAAAAGQDYEVVLYGVESDIQAVLEKWSSLPQNPANLTIEFVSSRRDALPAVLDDLVTQEINAIVTASNSKTLAARTLAQKMFNRPFRPGLIAPIPTETGTSYVLDVGATSRVTDPEVFVGWAEYGSAFLRIHCGKQNPTVGLCNIATERAYPELMTIHIMLQAESPNYIGYTEPYDFAKGKADLWLMEGFVGNENLKLLEAYMAFLTKTYASVLSKESAFTIGQKAKELFSYEAHLISPYLTQSGCWIFRVHGAASADKIAKAFPLAVAKYALSEPMW